MKIELKLMLDAFFDSLRRCVPYEIPELTATEDDADYVESRLAHVVIHADEKSVDMHEVDQLLEKEVYVMEPDMLLRLLKWIRNDYSKGPESPELIPLVHRLMEEYKGHTVSIVGSAK